MAILPFSQRTLSRNAPRLLFMVLCILFVRWYLSHSAVPREPVDYLDDYIQDYTDDHDFKYDPKVPPKLEPEPVLHTQPHDLPHQAVAVDKGVDLEPPVPAAPMRPPPKPEGSKEFIVVSLKGDNTSWLGEFFPDWKSNIFVMDDPTAPLTVKLNKGREATAYLTYLIDNYNSLPDYMVFLHALRYQWHNEDPMYDGVPMLQKLRLPRIEEAGYLNLRCSWTIGCPAEIKPALDPENVSDPNSERAKSERAYAQAFKELYPEFDVPAEVGVPCGAQFALTRNMARTRPREDFMRYRQWLWDTELPDSVSGRVLEYSWHMMFGKPAVHCPDAKTCFCKTYGLCDLTCPDDGSCEKRFHLPTYAQLPENWPEDGPGKDGWPARDWYL